MEHNAKSASVFWRHEPTSDVTIAVRVAGEKLPYKCLPGHSPVLSRASPVWKASLERWQQRHEDGLQEKCEHRLPAAATSCQPPSSNLQNQITSDTAPLPHGHSGGSALHSAQSRSMACRQPLFDLDPTQSCAPAPSTPPATAPAAAAAVVASTCASHTHAATPPEGGTQHASTTALSAGVGESEGCPVASPEPNQLLDDAVTTAAAVLQAASGAACASPASAPTALVLPGVAHEPAPAKAVLELLCDSEADVAAAEQLLAHVYGVPLLADPRLAVGALLLADRFQVDLDELYAHVEGLNLGREDLAVLAQAADLEVSEKVKQLLQKKLLDKLEASADMAAWLDGSPVGLDLEHCVYDRPRLWELGVAKLSMKHLHMLALDDRTKAASEFTVVAAMIAALPSANPSYPLVHQSRDIMQQLRWQHLSASCVSVIVQGGLLVSQQCTALQHAAVFPHPSRARALAILADRDTTPANPVRQLSASIDKPARPLSWRTSVTVDFDFSVDQLRESMAATTNDKMSLSGSKVAFSGLFWQPYLMWRQYKADAGSQQLAQCDMRLHVDGPAGRPLPPTCIIGAVYEVVVAGRTVVPKEQDQDRDQEQDRCTIVWGTGMGAIYDDVLQQGPMGGWPEDETLLAPWVQAGRLRGHVRIHGVL